MKSPRGLSELGAQSIILCKSENRPFLRCQVRALVNSRCVWLFGSTCLLVWSAPLAPDRLRFVIDRVIWAFEG